VDHPEETTLELVIGPMSLPAGGAHFRPPVQLATLPIEGWLHGFRWEMRDARGAPLPDRVLHHVNLIDPDRRELFAPIPRRVMAAGRETSAERMPGVLGYPVEAGTRVLISAMFAGLEARSIDAAYLHLRLDYTPKHDPGLIRPREVYPFYLDVMGPVGEKEFSLPPGEHGRSWEGSPAIDGRILAIGGHLHDYARWIRLEDVTTGDVLWETEPERSPEGRVVGVPTARLWWRGGIRIHRDHVYRISVLYRNPSDAPAPDGAMGALGGILLADRAEWPELDRTDVAYVTDLRNTLEKPNQAHDHAMGVMEDPGDADGAKAAPRHEHGRGADGRDDGAPPDGAGAARR
ncbi:MAG: hypothetical protein ACRELC_09700, partial [Gemmatimonadota bacterium]